MPSMCSTVLSTAARRASVSRLPSPASTRSRVRPVSSNVMLPELPDARMETRNAIVHPSENSFSTLNVIKTEIDVIRAQLSRNGIDVVTGTASFLDPHHMQVTSSRGQTEFEADNIVIATGTKPAVSPLVPFNDKTIINSD